MSKCIFECVWRPKTEGQACKYKVLVRLSDRYNRNRIGLFLCTKSNDCEYQEKKELKQ